MVVALYLGSLSSKLLSRDTIYLDGCAFAITIRAEESDILILRYLRAQVVNSKKLVVILAQILE